MECPKCGNRIGLAFGTCCECGYNYLTNKYDWIKIWVADLEMTNTSPEVQSFLIEKHDKLVAKYNVRL